MKNKALLFGLLIIAALLVAACQPQTVIETVVVEKEGQTIIETVEVEVEKQVEVIKEVEVAGGARGTSGTLTILYWQAVSTMNPFLSGGTKDIDASSLVLEPLARYDESANLVPWLVDEIPTVENGGVSEDLKSITWVLKEGLVWSDGTPVTSADVVFTGEYCLNPDMGCNALSGYADVESFEAIDDLTVRVNFTISKPFPYGPFVGAQNGAIIQKAQFEECTGAAAQECTDANFYPIGTGPFVVKEFRANDVVIFEANQNYRDPNKPFFQEVIFKGGGDAASAARAVLETGEADYAWNLQVEPEILRAMEAAGRGKVVAGFGTGVERLMVNFTNPAGLITQALHQYAPEVNTVGVCNAPITAKMQLLELVEEYSGEKFDPGQVELDTLGLNHLSWHRGLRVAGEDLWAELFPRIVERERSNPEAEWDVETLSVLCMLPNYYLQYFYYTDRKLAEQAGWPPSRAEAVMEIEADLLNLYAEPGLKEPPEELMQRGGAYYSTMATQLLNAHYNDLAETHVVNIPHYGAVAGWPADWVLEMPARVSRSGIEPLPASPLPQVCYGLIAQVKSYELLTVDAAVTGDRQAAYQALLTHPLGPPADRVQEILEDMLATNRAYLPRFWKASE